MIGERSKNLIRINTPEFRDKVESLIGVFCHARVVQVAKNNDKKMNFLYTVARLGELKA